MLNELDELDELLTESVASVNSNNHVLISELLIKSSANVHDKNEDGECVLMLAEFSLVPFK